MEFSENETANGHAFSQDEREALYKTVFTRRDVRGQFTPDPVPEDVLARILMAAHYAPSVGFMQPWNFIVIRSPRIKHQVHDLYQGANAEAANMFSGAQKATYQSLKLEGILESPINICITCDRERAGPVVIGRTHAPVTDVYSSVCAVQNLWLAARSEGLGMGWVSIFNHKRLKSILAMPKHSVAVAYVCLGYVTHFFDKPELQKAGWRNRLPLGDIVNFEQYGNNGSDQFAQNLLKTIGSSQQQLETEGYNGSFIASK